MSRPTKAFLTTGILVLASLALSACHIHGHLPPGQVKHILSEPPGHAKKR